MASRVLFTTSYRRKDPRRAGDTYDYAETYMKSALHFSGNRLSSYGLRFIRQNVPPVEILEYPTWGQYVERLQEGWDVVGFSFYLDEIHEILEMVETARRLCPGAQIWGGNYGVLTDEARPHFDRIFVGYAEHAVGQALGVEVGEIRHPPLVKWVGVSGVPVMLQGVLFTTRSCNFACSFCQTPPFGGKPSRVPLESLERVIAHYARIGVREVSISDEYFGMFTPHDDHVIDLLQRHGLRWRCQTRIDRLSKKLDDWSERGFLGAYVGIENLRDDHLRDMNKRLSIRETYAFVKEMHERGKALLGFYIIGLPDHTARDIKEEIRDLAALRLDMTQICILTPLPRTPQWFDIQEKFGIFERDWHNFDLHHLVWNHPRVGPEEMRDLLLWGLRRVHSTARFAVTARKILRGYGRGSVVRGAAHLLDSALRVRNYDFASAGLLPPAEGPLSAPLAPSLPSRG
ncbi:MAG: B12-binding domain-containing radical SAM protein [Halobacteria archaeon]